MAKSSTTILFNLWRVLFCFLLFRICNTSDLTHSDSNSDTLDPFPRESILRGEADGDQLAGEIDNDEFEDFIIGVFDTNNNSPGAVYVTYGGNDSSSFDRKLSLGSSDPAATGFKVTGDANNEVSLKKTGDLNSDGDDDIVIGVSSKESGQEEAYVIYGGERSLMSNIDLRTPVATGNIPDFLANSLNGGILIQRLPSGNNCSINCNRCNSPFSCTECTNPYLLYESQCVQSCPGDTFPSAGKCETQLIAADSRILQSCPTGCTACTVDGGPGWCQPIPCYYCSGCISGYYLSGTSCYQCVAACATCTGAAICQSCSSGYFLNGVQCIPSCPVGKYGDTLLRLCSACLSTCESCSDDSTCDSCPVGSFLFEDQCIPSCPITTWGDTVLRKCFDCPDDCDTCTSSSVCTICTIPYNLLVDQCVATCPLGMFPEAGVCKDCLSVCAQCLDFTNCTVCISSYYLFQNQCLTICPPRTFPSDKTGACENCPPHCSSCASKKACKICDEGYNLKDSLCAFPPSLDSQVKATKAVTSAVQAAGSVMCVGNPTFPITALVSQIVQNTRYINLTVTDELAEIYKTWNTDMIAWDPPNVVHKLDNFKTSPIVFSKYGLGSSFMANFWPTFMTIAIGLAVLCVSFVARIIIEQGQYRGRFYSLVKRLVAGSFNFVIVQVYGCLDDIIFDLVLDAKTNPFDTVFSWSSLVFAVGFLAVGCGLVYMNMRVVKRYQGVKAEALERKDMSIIETFNENNKYWALFYSEFNDEDFWSQSALALFIIRGTFSSLIIAVFYDYPMMQTTFLVMLDGAVILFLITKKPLKELRGTLAQYYFEIITLLVHFCTFLLALQDTFPSPSEQLMKVLCISIMYLNTILIAGSLFFMGIEIYDIIRLKVEEKKKKYDHLTQNTTISSRRQPTDQIMTTVEDNSEIEVPNRPNLISPQQPLEASNLFSVNSNTSLSGMRILKPRTLDLSMNAHDSVQQDIEIGNEINRQRTNQNRSQRLTHPRQRRTTRKKPQQQQQPSEGFLFLRNPARHLREKKT